MSSSSPPKINIKPEKGKKYFYYYPQLVVVIGVKNKNKINFMPCVWNTGLSYDPFLYGVSVGSDRYTKKMLDKANEFSINFLQFDDVQLVRSFGRSSGGEINKIDEFNVEYYNSEEMDIPLLQSAYLSLECKKFSKTKIGDHDLFVGEVNLMHINESLLNDYILDTGQVSPILYLGVDHYIEVSNDSLISLKNLPFHYKKIIK